MLHVVLRFAQYLVKITFCWLSQLLTVCKILFRNKMIFCPYVLLLLGYIIMTVYMIAGAAVFSVHNI